MIKEFEGKQKNSELDLLGMTKGGRQRGRGAPENDIGKGSK